MATLVGILLAIAPFAALAALVLFTEQRHRRRHAEVARQIALTDALHARLGALVAPVVRRRGRAWQVAVAVPYERPAVVTSVLDTVEELFGRGGYEVVLSRQAPVTSAPAAPRPAGLRRESLSWT
jgi:hypothetical protein